MEPFVNSYQPESIPEQFKDGTSPLPTILVINNEIPVREYLHSALDYAYHIEVASYDSDGMRLAKQMMPDLIIIDAHSPAGDDALCFQFKRSERTSHIPVLVLTLLDDQTSRIKSFYLSGRYHL